MPDDQMRYDQLAQTALRGVVREALRIVEKSGLPGEHHFYIAFLTKHPGVMISDRLAARYPREMTIVLQHQFWNLAVYEDHFEVELSFDNVPEKLFVPFSAVKGFLDPYVQFGLQFEVVPVAEETKPETQTPTATEARPPSPSAADEDPQQMAEGEPKVVSLDAFRKK